MVPVRDSIRRARPLLGTFVEICASGDSRAALEAAVDDAFGAIDRVHRLMSFHDAESDVGRLNREAGLRATAVDDWTYDVLAAALALNHRSAGLFDLAVAPALQKRGVLPDVPRTIAATTVSKGGDAAFELLPNRRVCLRDARVCLDLGGIAKGFAVDRAIEALQRHDVPSAIVNAGGDLSAYGSRQIVYIRHPHEPRQHLCAVEVTDDALATSGPVFDPFQAVRPDHSAIIDPRTQASADGIAGATVRARSCMMADALTKTLMIAGEDAGALLAHYGAEALLVFADGTVLASAGWEMRNAA